nr:hypothetical protein Iba_chr14dCG2210 [Ipomoea batatas]
MSDDYGGYGSTDGSDSPPHGDASDATTTPSGHERGLGTAIRG